MSIEIGLEANHWAKLTEELVQKGVGKNYISAELKSMLGKIATKGKPILRKHTPVFTGFLYASVASKADRTKDKLSAWAILGYRNPKLNKHQYWVTQGTKGRSTKSGAFRGMMKPAKPDPFKETSEQLKQPAIDKFYETIDAAKIRAVKKMNDKYGNSWGPL